MSWLTELQEGELAEGGKILGGEPFALCGWPGNGETFYETNGRMDLS